MKSNKRIPNVVLKHKNLLVAVAVFFVATASFMWPMFTHPSTYSDGGDHMFNAWTLARDHFCLLRQHCPNYDNGNIFFPHKDSMLYSETQLSAGLLTLPFFFLNQNPLFSANIWYLLSCFFAGFFMYMLARYLSKGNQPISILAGLLFEFAPTKITSMDHLQNLSIFYLPLIILLLLKYRETGSKKYLAGFTLACILLFFASWYQMVFGLLVIGLFILFVFIADRSWALGGWLALATLFAIATTLPLAKNYVRFSKANGATFSIANQIEFSSSIDDYVLPYENTPMGAVYYKVRPSIQRNTHNPDNYSYAGITLYVIFAACLFELFRKTRGVRETEKRQLTWLLTAVLLAGFIFSLGPAIKIGSRYIYHIQSTGVVLAAPYILVDKFLPQLSFMRAVGRASEIVLFALCGLLAIFSMRLAVVRPHRKRLLLTGLLILVVALDLLPIKLITTPFQPVEAYKTNFAVPAVYKYIKAHKSIDDIVIIRTHKDYPYAGIPIAPAEDVLWSGYDNRDIFNGYSGYTPPEYQPTLQEFNNFQPGDVKIMKSLGLKYVLLDKQLSDPALRLKQKMASAFHAKVYEDSRYILFKI